MVCPVEEDWGVFCGETRGEEGSVGDPPEERRGEEVPDGFWSSLRKGRKMGCSFFLRLGSSVGQLNSGARDLWRQIKVSHDDSNIARQKPIDFDITYVTTFFPRHTLKELCTPLRAKSRRCSSNDSIAVARKSSKVAVMSGYLGMECTISKMAGSAQRHIENRR